MPRGIAGEFQRILTEIDEKLNNFNARRYYETFVRS